MVLNGSKILIDVEQLLSDCTHHVQVTKKKLIFQKVLSPSEQIRWIGSATVLFIAKRSAGFSEAN